MRLVANLSILFPRVPFLDRFDAAARAGFDEVEFWWPSADLAAGMSLGAIVNRARDAQLGVVMMNFDGGNMPAGDRGLAGDPDRAAAFRANVPVAIELAERLGCRKLNALAGKRSPDVAGERNRAVLARSVVYAADHAARAGMTVLLEPLNPTETPDYLLPDVATTLDLIEQVECPNVKLQFDVYHIAMGGADPAAMAHCARGRIGHVQLADVPGRHEPFTGQLAFVSILAAIRDAGYDDAVGLEYNPSAPEGPDFGFVAALRPLLESQPTPPLPR